MILQKQLGGRNTSMQILSVTSVLSIYDILKTSSFDETRMSKMESDGGAWRMDVRHTSCLKNDVNRNTLVSGPINEHLRDPDPKLSCQSEFYEKTAEYWSKRSPFFIPREMYNLLHAIRHFFTLTISVFGNKPVFQVKSRYFDLPWNWVSTWIRLFSYVILR